jgi:hypothetical protein
MSSRPFKEEASTQVMTLIRAVVQMDNFIGDGEEVDRSPGEDSDLIASRVTNNITI